MPVKYIDPGTGATIYVPTEEEKQSLENQKELVEDVTRNNEDVARLTKVTESIEVNAMYPPPPLAGMQGGGSVDNTSLLQTVINYATNQAKLLNTRAVVYIPSSTYNISGTVYIDTSYVTLRSSGARLYYTSNTGTMFVLTNFQDRSYKQNFTVMEDLYLEGVTRGSSTAIIIKGDRTEEGGIGKGACHIKLKSVNIAGFNKGVTFGNNAYLITFNGCDIYDCDYCIDVPNGLVNSGERITFSDCTIFNSYMALKLDGWFDIHFIGCSLDYCQKFIEQTRGNVFVSHSSIETENIVAPLFKVTKGTPEVSPFGDEKPTLSIRDSIITFWALYGYTQPLIETSVNTFVTIKDNTLPFAQRYASRFLVSGDAQVICKNNNYNGGKFLVSKQLNALSFGDIKSTTNLSVLADNPDTAIKPKIDSTIAYTNNASLKFSVTTNNHSGVMRITNFTKGILPGNSFVASAMFNRGNYTGNIVLKVLVNDYKGELIDLIEMGVPAGVTGWVPVTLPIIKVPQNAEYLDLIIQSEAMTTSQYFNADDIHVNII